MVALFIDSANRADVTRLLGTGLFAGVTTNPEIIEKAGLRSRDIPDIVDWASTAGARQVFVQSWGRSPQEIADRGEELRRLGPNVTVKVPASSEGISAARLLAGGGSVLVTAVYSAAQVIPIMSTGATYLAPFVGRMDARGRDGMAEVRSIQNAIDASGSELQVLAGSLRTPQQVLDLATAGVQNATFSPAVWDSFFTDELTAESVERFEHLASA